jgi:hypothetical protein
MPNPLKSLKKYLSKRASRKASNETQVLGVPIRALDKSTFVSKSATKKSLPKSKSAHFGGRRTRKRKHRHTRKCKH